MRATVYLVWLRSHAVLLGLVALSAALRLASLSRESLWTDEGGSIFYAASFASAFQDANPPLYYVLLSPWIHVFGVSELAVRLPSVVFGCLTVVSAYVLADRLLGRRAALYVGGLLALSTL